MIESLTYRESDNFRESRREKRKKEKVVPQKFYTVSNERLNYGKILTAVASDGRRSYIYMSTSPVPHESIVGVKFGGGQKAFVYEVEPISDVEYGLADEEIKAKQVMVVKFVGDAESILRNHGNKPSKVVHEVHTHGVRVRGLNRKKAKTANLTEKDEREKTSWG
ncbi:hypothetical protein A2572_03110 [Candidatus Collierbacteria bacterium RIFOXYD1_FULL_40_9]|uniref:Uncharacterized protein n=1 Tax=Candidatus Collierbacteria bacterium RIFOXYD1_FULL_40_9 TaxID=1817731 RepID=A0A1F5FWX3_9BACT|nr:MAG: hypothetical protein A2572_03110 [Candidatus Collierbacteria bacterium RIFOXYD1_FULL_40_9]